MARERVAKPSVVIDTNVVAYHLLKTDPFHRQIARLLRRLGKLHAPDSWQPELLSALWGACREGLLSVDQAEKKLRLAKSFGIESHAISGLWSGALRRAVRENHPPYDTLFVELAFQLDLPFVTYDEQVLEKFPQVAIRPGEFQLP